jgi:hypothetical protein
MFLVSIPEPENAKSPVPENTLPPSRGDHSQLRSAEISFGIAAEAGDDFLNIQLAEHEDADRDARDLLVDTVNHRLRLGRTVHAEPRLRAIVAAGAAFGRGRQAGAGDDRVQQRKAAGAWQRFDRVALVLRLRARTADVNNRRLAGDGHRLFKRADSQVGVHGGGELRL